MTRGDLVDCLIEHPKGVRSSLRAGKYKNLSVTYKTFVTDSSRTAHQVSNQHSSLCIDAYTYHIYWTACGNSNAAHFTIAVRPQPGFQPYAYPLASRHVNLAVLVGATEGYKGLNGIIVAARKCVVFLG